MRKHLLYFLSFVFFLCLIFQSVEVNADCFYKGDPQLQINPGKADVSIQEPEHDLIRQKDKDVFYRIQFKAEPVKESDLKVLEKQSHQSILVIEKHKGLFKYLSEPISSHYEAIRQLKLVRTYRGFENSFIVIYRNGFRINADGSQSVVQYLGKENAIDLKKVSVNKLPNSKLVSENKPVRKIRGIQYGAITSTIKEKVMRVAKMPFINYNRCTILLIFSMLVLNFAFIAMLLLIHHIYIKRKERNHQELKKLYAEALTDFIIDRSIDPAIPVPLLKVNTYFKKNLLIQEMINAIHNSNDDTEEKVKALYYKLELQHHSIRKLNSRKLILQVSAMRELSVFNVSEANDRVEAFLNHKNQILRQEALLCLLRLKPDNSFEQLLNHPDETIRESIICAIGEMHLTNYCEQLIVSYKKENKKNQLSILDTMCKLGDPKLLDFLSDIVLKDADMEKRLQAAKALVNIDSLGLMRMQVLLLTQDKDIEIIYKQVTAKPI